jgi:WD40 repeat protein
VLAARLFVWSINYSWLAESKETGRIGYDSLVVIVHGHGLSIFICRGPDWLCQQTATQMSGAAGMAGFGQGEIARVLNGHDSDVVSLAFSEDGQWLATTSEDHTMRLWSVAEPVAEPLVSRGHEGVVWSMAFSLDGQWLTSDSNDATVKSKPGQPTIQPVAPNK